MKIEKILTRTQTPNKILRDLLAQSLLCVQTLFHLPLQLCKVDYIPFPQMKKASSGGLRNLLDLTTNQWQFHNNLDGNQKF